MRRETALALVVGLLVVVVTALSIVVAHNRSSIGAVTATASQQRDELRRDEQRLAAALHTLAVSQKASTQTRVSTVTQRCALTNLVLGVLVRVHDTADAALFRASEMTCLKQLASVIAINAATPSPR